MEEGRYSRGYLPHIEAPGLSQFVTWRLADSLSESAVLRMRSEAEAFPEGERRAAMARQIEAFCDAGHGACVLADPLAARLCQEALFAHHSRLYHLHAWVVMPNHVHALLTMHPGFSLSDAMRLVRGASSREINRLLGRKGRLWQPESFDRFVRSARHFEGVGRYIEWNPVKAGLCRDPNLFPWTSASESARKRLESFGQDESCGPRAG